MGKTNEQKTIVIGIPHMGIFKWKVVTSLLGLLVPNGYKIKYHFVGSCLIYEARESIVKFALENNASYILFMDSDMAMPQNSIVQMINVLTQTDAEIVSGTAFKRVEPFQPCYYTTVGYNSKEYKPHLESPVEFPKEGLLPVQGFGMACCMIDCKVFDKIDKPYFFPLPNLGEDLTFCLKAKHKEIKMYVDLSIDVKHLGDIEIGQEHYRLCYEEYKKMKTDKPMFAKEE